MKKMLCLAVFALGLATPAVAADWVLVSIDSNEAYVIFGDADSRTDNRAWFETRYTKPKKIGDGKFYNTTKTLREMDCSGKRDRLLTVTAYSKSGNPIGSDTRSYAEWDYVIPGTVGESMYKFVCNRYPR
ncbi:TPA: surface-adhesin E family protein [Neisseria subflava]